MIMLNPSWSLHKAYPTVHGANMGPTWVLSAPDGPHVGPMNLAIRVYFHIQYLYWDTLQQFYNHICWKHPTGVWITIKNHFKPKFFRGNIKHIFTFHIIPLHWYHTGGWNPSSNKTRTYPFFIVNIMAAGVLATQGARTSAAMILT